MQELVANFRILDAVDIGVIAFLVYQALDLIRGTRAARMLLGLGVVFLFFVASQVFDLYTVNWLLERTHLLEIEPRAVTEYRISLSRSEMTSITWVLLLLLPGGTLALACCGGGAR